MGKYITVVTVVYNCEDYISSCIQSVITQPNIDEIEYIIIDGGSTD
ncbi:glycosyltransferase, partial [Vibrio parahaemolyticus]|nr:glycosyltransferase [Vibrio parahaemolyticus]